MHQWEDTIQGEPDKPHLTCTASCLPQACGYRVYSEMGWVPDNQPALGVRHALRALNVAEGKSTLEQCRRLHTV